MSNAEDFTNMEAEIRMGMNLVDRTEFKATIQAISHIAADTVKKTLGPYAHTTIIDDGHFTYPTKDGWSVLSRLTFQDPTLNSIFNVLKNISFRIVDKVGDGTTTAMVAADHFITEMLKNDEFQTSYRQKDIVDALDRVRDLLVTQLKEDAIQIAPAHVDKELTMADYKPIYDVAFTSSNGNHKLAEIMQAIYYRTGNPNVLVDMEGGNDLSFEIQTGYRLDCTHLMHERYTNTSEGYYSSMHAPHMFIIFDHSVNYQKHSELIDTMLRYAQIKGAAPVIMAPYFDDIISAQFAQSVNEMLKRAPSSIPGLFIIQIPNLTTKLQKQYMQDFAALANLPITDSTKVKVFNELRHNERVEDPAEHITDSAMTIDGYNYTTAQALLESCCGTVSEFTLGKNFITLNEANRESVRYKEKLAEAKEEYERASEQAKNAPTSLMKDYLDASQRLNKLSGALGVIHIGGASDLERQCIRDSVDDTFRACRSAFENGVVSGLNMGTLVAIRKLKKHEILTPIENDAIDMLYDAMEETTLDVLRNKKDLHDDWRCNLMDWAGPDDAYIEGDVLVEEIANAIEQGTISGYDIVTEELCLDKIPTVINSVSTDIEILYAIVSILGTILTSDQYLSVSRMYDKTAAIRHQEKQNDLTLKRQLNTILTSVGTYMKENMDTIAALLGRGPVYDSGTTDAIALYHQKSQETHENFAGYPNEPFIFHEGADEDYED